MKSFLILTLQILLFHSFLFAQNNSPLSLDFSIKENNPSEWNTYRKHNYIYDQKGNLLKDDMQFRSSPDEVFEPFQTEYQYDVFGNLTATIELFLNDETYELDTLSKRILEYDDQQQITKDLFVGEYENKKYSTFFYDLNQCLEQEDKYAWQYVEAADKFDWVLLASSHFERNSNCDPVVTTVMGLNGYESKLEYIYDANGFLIEKKWYFWNGQNWDFNHTEFITNDAEGRPLIILNGNLRKSFEYEYSTHFLC